MTARKKTDRVVCYQCGGKVVRVQHPLYATIDCERCGPDRRFVAIIREMETSTANHKESNHDRT